MTSELDLVAIFGPTAERTLDGAAHRAELVAEVVLSTGARYPFDQPVIIGRTGEGLVPPPDKPNIRRIDVDSRMLSRQHACISPVGRRASVVDLGSTNGTLVVTPDRGAIACLPGRLMLFEVGWRVELGGAVWVSIEPHSHPTQAHLGTAE